MKPNTSDELSFEGKRNKTKNSQICLEGENSAIEEPRSSTDGVLYSHGHDIILPLNSPHSSPFSDAEDLKQYYSQPPRYDNASDERTKGVLKD